MDSLAVWYDRDGDTLEVTFEDVPAMLVELNDDVFERRTTDGRVVRFTVMNFSQYDCEKLTLPLSVIAKEV